MLFAALTGLATFAAGGNLASGVEALAAFRIEEAVSRLSRALEEGPYGHADHVRLYESLGIAQASLGDEPAALAAFTKLLILSPGHALSYTLSPKVTFVFERARGAAGPPPTLELGWPYDLRVEDAVPLTLEVVINPGNVLARAVVYARRQGDPAYVPREVSLAPVGRHVTAVLPSPEPGAERDVNAEVYVVGLDARGNEITSVGSAATPREVHLAYRPDPWYSHWWVWAVGAVVVGGAAVGATMAATARVPDRVPTLIDPGR